MTEIAELAPGIGAKLHQPIDGLHDAYVACHWLDHPCDQQCDIHPLEPMPEEMLASIRGEQDR